MTAMPLCQLSFLTPCPLGGGGGGGGGGESPQLFMCHRASATLASQREIFYSFVFMHMKGAELTHVQYVLCISL